MGAVYNKPRVILVRGSYNRETEKAVPAYTYKPFPKHRSSTPGSLIMKVKATPQVKDEENELYWWTDCEFLPNNDSQVVATSSAFIIQPNQALTFSPGLPYGKVCGFDLDPQTVKCVCNRQTSVAALPKLQPFPDGNNVVYIGAASGDIKVLSLENGVILSRAQDIRFRPYKHVAVTCDGRRFAIMARASIQHRYELLIYKTDYTTFAEHTIDCYHINQDFRGSKLNLEHTACKWSPDSLYVAASISHGSLIVISRQTQTCVCDVFSDVIPDTGLSRQTTFDFNPQSCHQVVAVGTRTRFLYIVNVDDGTIISQTEDVCGEHAIDAVRYSVDGQLVGVTLRNFTFQLHDADTCCTTYRFNMKDSLPSLQNPSSGPHPSIVALSFSSSGEQAVTSMADGFICFWQLPRKMNLQFLCKLRILTCVGLDRVSSLPLPPRMKDYLLSLPTML